MTYNVDKNNIQEEESNEIETSSIPVKQQLALLVLIFVLIFGAGFAPKIMSRLKSPEQSQPANIPYTTTDEETANIDYFENIILVGKAAFVWDVNEQRALYKKNPDAQLPLASITKLMTALVARELLANDKTITITLSAIKQEGESGLNDGETFTLENLTDLALMTSSNDAAFAMASAAGVVVGDTDSPKAFIGAMNIRATELGLTRTYFRNPTGLDISETESGAYSSARDTAFLMEYILKTFPEILERTQEDGTVLSNEEGSRYDIENTNTITAKIPGLIGSKTGYTELAGGNLVIAFDAGFNHPIVVVVLGSTQSNRFNDVLALTDAARKSVSE